MAGRGAFHAVSQADARRLLSATDDEELLELLNDIYLRESDSWHQDTDKAWHGVDRALTVGTVHRDSPLQRCVFGGKLRQDADDHIVCCLEPDRVREVAEAINRIDKKWMQRPYWQIDQDEYEFPLSEDDFEYVWCWFKRVKAF
jgi:hypothetical protein